ncbi:ABC transporter ATP-binding protein [Mesorhizobium sp. CAU 1741]|uniref:ABC transporter ATP-binding protein n=1 Tax=Mesorhizobium sp. CAU 1741 TaxID=3140366 RepID=UPI00325C1CAD
MHASLRGIRVRFGQLVAVDDVSVDIEAGRVLAVVGENGAGKSTLMNALFGLFQPEAGEIVVDGQPRRWASPQDAIRAGLGMVHQHFMLQEEMTVLENIVLCGEPVRLFGFVDFAVARRKLEDGFAQNGISIDLDARVGSLSVGQKQVVEILKMLYRDASLLILDEPTAVLTPLEKDQLFAILRGFAQQGKAVVIITHKLDEVMEIADHVVVMRGGRLVSSLPVGETSKDRLSREIVGGELPPALRAAAREPGEVVLGVDGLHVAARGHDIGPISFDVRAGEIVGIAGVSGNGQSELIQALTGLRPAKAGMISLAGTRVETLGVRERRLAGQSYIPEDRQRVGLALGASVADNASAGHDDPRHFTRGPFLDRSAMARYARDLIERYRIKVAGPQALVSTMSGGNKQKLVVSRELSRATPLIIAENPTWGVDIGAIELIHAELMRMRDAGHAVLLVSTELDEVLKLSDRIMVMYSGSLSEPIAAAEADRNRIGALMTSRTGLGSNAA